MKTLQKMSLVVIVAVGIACLLYASIAIFRTIIYIKNDPKDPIATGQFPQHPVWEISLDSQVSSTPVVYGSHVFIRTLDSLYAIDPLTGSKIWQSYTESDTKQNANTINQAPIVGNGLVFVSETDSKIAAFQIDSGNLAWRTEPIQANNVNPGVALIESMVIEGQVLCVARGSWDLTTYDSMTGDILWVNNVPNRSALTLSKNQGNIYLASNKKITEFQSHSGDVLWERDFYKILGDVALEDNVLFIAFYSDDIGIIAIDLQTKNQIWSVNVADLEIGDTKKITLNQDRFYVSANKMLAVSKETGDVIWITEDMEYLETPVFIDNSLFVRNIRRQLFMLNATNGDILGTLSVKLNAVMKWEKERGPVVYQDILLVPFGDNRIYAYRP